MTDAFIEPRESRDSADRRAVVQRLVEATVAAHAATERYVEIRRYSDLGAGELSDMLAESNELREQLRAVVSSYVALLRRDGTAPERVVVLVKDAVESAHVDLDARSRHAIMDEMVRWAVAAYFAT